MKKTISLLLSVIMLLSVFSIVGSAAGTVNPSSLLTVKATYPKDNYVTYNVYLKKGANVCGAIVRADYDESVLTIDGGLSGGYGKKDSDGNFIYNISGGIFEKGAVAGKKNSYTVAFARTSEYKVTSDKPFMSFTFKYDGSAVNYKRGHVEFKCVEFNSETGKSIAKDDTNPPVFAKFDPSTLNKIKYGKFEAVENGIKLAWYATEGATGYQVYKKNTSGNYEVIAKLGSTARSYVDTDLKYDQTATYIVRATNKYGNDNYNKSVSATYYAVPQIKSFSANDSGIYMNWNATKGATGYRVYRKTAGTGWKYLGATKSTSYTDKDAAYDGKYTYTVRAEHGSALSYFDTTGWSMVRLREPAVKSVAREYNGLRVSWNAIKGAENYRVYRRESGTSKWTYIAKTTSTSYLDKKASSNKTYYYTVRAAYNDFLSTFNNGKGNYYIAAPSLKLSSDIGGVKITWNKVSGATGYRIYRKTAGANWKYVTKVTTTSYTDKNVSSNGTYFYTVRAEKGNTLSNYNTAGYKITFLATPVVTSGSANVGFISVDWKAVSGAQQYRVYRKVNSESKWRYVTAVKGTHFEDKDVSDGNSYYYTVRAEKDGKLSAYNDAGKKVNYLAQPKLYFASVKEGLRLTWNKTSGTDYYIYKKETPTSNWKRIAVVNGTSYIDKSAKSGVPCAYTIRAHSSKGLSSFAPDGWTYTYIAQPEISSVDVNVNSITVNWNAIDGADLYRVYRKENNDSKWKLIDLVENTSTYEDKNVTDGNKYTYTVRAEIQGRLSSFNDAGKGANYLAAPVLKIENTEKGVALSWNKTAAADYYIYKKSTPESNWKRIAVEKGTELLDTDVKEGESYIYTIRSHAPSVLSDFLEEGYTVTYTALPVVE